MNIMRSELEIPLKFARVAIQGEQTIGVEIVSNARIAVPVRPRIAGAPEDGVLLRIVSAGNPGGGSAGFRGVGGPRFAPGLASGRHSPETPCPPAGFSIIGIDKATHTVLATGHADHDLVLEREWRGGDRVTQLRVGNLSIPAHNSRFNIERHQMRVEGAG